MEEVTLDQVRAALAARDPKVVDLVVALARQSLPTRHEDGTPYREGAPTFQGFVAESRRTAFRKQPKEDQGHWRRQQVAALENEAAEIPLPDRLRAHEVILELWTADDLFSRTCLKDLLRDIPLSYGPWRAVKRIFKEAEAADDTEVMGLLAARFDLAVSGYGAGDSTDAPTRSTMLYLRRRGWRYLRRLGETLPACYPDAAADFLVGYSKGLTRYNVGSTWIAAHILFHEQTKYTRNRFRSSTRDVLKFRAFADTWRRSPRPLFGLLERARSELVHEFATQALKSDFRASIREVEPEWVVRLVTVGSDTIDEFVVWVLENVPRFEPAAFRELGLHGPTLHLLDSNSKKARVFAADYARNHARDLDLDTLIHLAVGPRAEARQLARDLILERDPRKDIGLDTWGRLVVAAPCTEWAADALRKHFGASELTPDWFRGSFAASRSLGATRFLTDLLLKLHPAKKLGHAFFTDLVDRDYYSIAEFCTDQLRELGPAELSAETLQRLLVIGWTRQAVVGWVNEGLVEPKAFGPGFLKSIAFHPTWETSPVVADVRASFEGLKDMEYSEELSETIFGWLRDIRKFTPDELGFEWLMQLVQRGEARYHDFAVDTMIRAFLPADFAPVAEAPKEKEKKAKEEIQVDLGGQKFLFTGKLATMTRSEARKKVTAAGGANASGVAKSLDFLVIGDEGSPLYGQGRKGSKQLKAEALREEGSDLKIISETAFLQMLSGEQREMSDDAVRAGCERLWAMMTEAEREDDPLAAFARQYVRRHHPEICLRETDRPVDPGAEIPDSFLTFEQVKPLLSDSRKTLRDFALEMASWEFARWNPPIEGVIDLCETPYAEVREFVATALTVDPEPEHKRYRLDPEVLTADAVYRFCESNDPGTRALGMLLIDRNPRLRVPDELFRLTESPDRNVRAFAVRAFWSLYRDRGTTRGWKPVLPPQPTTGKKAKADAEAAAERLGTGAPERPENPPASEPELRALLRRVLFEIPPGPPEKRRGGSGPHAPATAPQPQGQALPRGDHPRPRNGGQAIRRNDAPAAGGVHGFARQERIRRLPRRGHPHAGEVGALGARDGGGFVAGSARWPTLPGERYGASSDSRNDRRIRVSFQPFRRWSMAISTAESGKPGSARLVSLNS